MEQVSNYCKDRGCPIGIVTNGHQVVAFIASRIDGVSPFEGQALVFPSLKNMLDDFLEFWNFLSKLAIKGKKIQNYLAGNIVPAVPPKLSSEINRYPGRKDRNPFQLDLMILSELILEDMTRAENIEKDFLRECYCRSGALAQNLLVSKKVLQARYAALFAVDTPRPTTLPIRNKKEISSEIIGKGLSRRPCILIGDVGVGKTSFIKNLVKIEAVGVFKNAITFYIDLGSQATLTEELKRYVLDEIERQLLEKFKVDIEEKNFVRGVYNKELQRFSKGINADLKESNPTVYQEREIEFLQKLISNKEQFLKASLEHISKGRKKQIILFIDNVDQRKFEVQQDAFLIAQEISEHWPFFVFITLRPETFNHSLKSGALSGYHPKAFTIAPPRIEQVLEKRLRFAQKVASGEVAIERLDNTTAKLENIKIIMAIFSKSLLVNKQLSELIENISGGNVRLALEIVKLFFGSGHVDTEKIVRVFKETGSYIIPTHEFLRAVMYGDCEYYSPDVSYIANLFDVSSYDQKEHFLSPMLIGVLISSTDSSTAPGFVRTSVIYEKLQSIGFTSEQIDFAIARVSKKKLLEASARQTPMPGQIMPDSMRVTSIGCYHTQRLCHLFAYIDAIIVDTPIFDDKRYERLHGLDSNNIVQRLDRAEIFRQYLDDAWSTIEDGIKVFNWKILSAKLEKEIMWIKSRLF